LGVAFLNKMGKGLTLGGGLGPHLKGLGKKKKEGSRLWWGGEVPIVYVTNFPHLGEGGFSGAWKSGHFVEGKGMGGKE